MMTHSTTIRRVLSVAAAGALSIATALGLVTPTGQLGVTAAYAATEATTPVYELFNPNSGEFFYTISQAEAKAAKGWIIVGTPWTTAKAGTPVYRVFNPKVTAKNKAASHYFGNHGVCSSLVKNSGYRWDYNQKPVFYFNSKDPLPVYVAYNKNTGAHLMTIDKSTYNRYLGAGWTPNAVQFKANAVGPVMPKQVDVGDKSTGSPTGYRMLYSDKAFDSFSNPPAHATMDFSANVSLTGTSDHYTTQFVIAGNQSGSGKSGQIGVELTYQKGTDQNFGQGKIAVATINFPAGASAQGGQWYSVNTSAPAVAKGKAIKLEVKYFGSQKMMQTFVNGKLVGQYKTTLAPGKGSSYILHDTTTGTPATATVNNITVTSNGATAKGAPAFKNTTSNTVKAPSSVVGAYLVN